MSIALTVMVQQLAKRVEALEQAQAISRAALRSRNASRQAEGARLREAISKILDSHPNYSAKQVLKALSPSELGHMPSVRRVQEHIKAVRDACRGA